MRKRSHVGKVVRVAARATCGLERFCSLAAVAGAPAVATLPAMESAELTARLAPYFKHGPAAGALRLAKRALAPWLQWGSLVFFELPLVPGPEPEPGLRVRELVAGDVDAAAAAFGSDPRALEARLQRGDRAFCAFDQLGTPLHARWATASATPIPEAGLWLRPRAGEVYLYDVITHPLHRGRRLTSAVRAVMDRALLEQGFRFKLGYVRGDNCAMLRTIDRGHVASRRLCEVRYLRLANQPPVLSGSFSPPVHAEPD